MPRFPSKRPAKMYPLVSDEPTSNPVHHRPGKTTRVEGGYVQSNYEGFFPYVGTTVRNPTWNERSARSIAARNRRK